MATYHGIYSVRLQDFIGVKGTAVLYGQIPDSLTIAQLATAAADMNLILDPITDAFGLRCRMEIIFPNTNLKTAVSANTRLDDGALFTMLQSTINRASGVVVPAFAQAQIANGKPVIGGSSPAQEFINELLATGGVFTKESPEQYTFASFSSVRLNDRKHRKAETRVTTEV